MTNKLHSSIIEFVEEHTKCSGHIQVTYPSWPYARLVLTCHPCGDDLELSKEEEDDNNPSS